MDITRYGNDSGSTPGSILDLDFTTQSYYVKGKKLPLDKVVSFTRASTAYGYDGTDTLRTYTSGNPVINERGFLSSSSRTNALRNSSMTGGSAPSTIPTFWQSLNGNGLTRTYAYGTNNGKPYVDIRFNGTASDANGVDVRFEQSNGIAALNGQTWTQSVELSIVGGSITNVTAIWFNNYIRDSSTTSLGTASSSNLKFVLTEVPQRIVNTFTTSNASTAYVQPIFQITYNSGAAIDITIRISIPQIELGSYPSAPILTTNAAVTRSADVMSLLDSSLIPISGTVFVEFEESTSTNTGVSRYIWSKYVDSQNWLRSIIDGNQKARFSESLSNSEVVSILPSNAASAGTIYRQASAYGANDFSVAWSAILQGTNGTNTSASIIGSNGTVYIGNFNSANQADCWIRRIIAFPTRKSNADLLAWAQATIPNQKDTISKNANIDMNFVKGTAWTGGQSKPLSGVYSSYFTRSSSAWNVDPTTGIVSSASTNAPRYNSSGLLLEPSRTNSVRNFDGQSGGTTGTIGSGGTLPTNWSINSITGITYVFNGKGTEFGMNYTEWRVYGTNTSGSNSSLAWAAELTAYVSAASGQYWSSSAYVRLVSGNMPNSNNAFSSVFGRGTGGTSMELVNGTPVVISSVVPTKVSATILLANASSIYVSQKIEIGIANGVSCDFVIRIYHQQLEQGPFSTSPILQGASTRAQDLFRMTYPQSGLNVSTGYLFWRGVPLGYDPAGSTRIMWFSNASNTTSRVEFIVLNNGRIGIILLDDSNNILASGDSGTSVINSDVCAGITWGGGTCRMKIGPAAAFNNSGNSPSSAAYFTLGSRQDYSSPSYMIHKRIVGGPPKLSDAEFDDMFTRISL